MCIGLPNEHLVNQSFIVRLNCYPNSEAVKELHIDTTSMVGTWDGYYESHIAGSTRNTNKSISF